MEAMRRTADVAVESVLDEGLQPAASGRGVLFQRDYWGVVRGCRMSPSEVIDLVRRQFEDFSPPGIARFRRQAPDGVPLAAGDELSVDIRMAGRYVVRVTDCSPQCFTLATLQGHPEAGRITFGAYRNGRGDVIFHIRSRARSNTWKNYIRFLVGGDPMQTYTWTDFVDSVAHTVGEGVIGVIHAEMHVVDQKGEDDSMDLPTFWATGD